jgi:peptidoglycan hydrolase-like protein with peptidoglycan-binding domain
MLRVIGESRDQPLTVIPDGIDGPQTAGAVTQFQRDAGLPATGIADQQTWEEIVSAYEPALILVAPAEPLELILNPGQIIRKDEYNLQLYVVQAVLIALSKAYGSIPQPTMNGILDIPTSQSLSRFQELHQLPVTGELDKITWKHLAKQYPMAINIQDP